MKARSHRAPTDTAARARGQRLEAISRRHGLTGASFACWDGRALHTAVTGVRNSVTRDPMTADTLLPVGSITKILNTVLLLQLVEEDKVALGDLVIRYLPDLRLRDRVALERITCKMLLNHTSGIDGDMLPDHGPDHERIVDAIARCAELEQIHAPGEAASYCNIATVIAGHLTQTLRNASWYDLIRTRIFEPLGMHSALVSLTDLPRFRHSVGDLTDHVTGALVQTTRPFLPLSFAPAGATMMATATDIVTFGRAMATGGVGSNGVRVLSADLVRLMQHPTAEFHSPVCKIGLGWMILPDGLLTHGGTTPGGAARLYVHPASGRVAVFLTNCDRKQAIAEFLAAEGLGSASYTADGQALTSQVAPASLAADPSDLSSQEIAGVYETRLQRIEVRAQGAQLTLQAHWKTRVLDNTPSQAIPRQVSLRRVSVDVYEAPPDRPGLLPMQVRFVRRHPGSPVRYLATEARLLPRVERHEHG